MRREGLGATAVAVADFDWCLRLAKLVANSTRQRVDEATPLLSAALPTGERAQMVLPPATTAGTVAITIRRPSEEVWSIDELAKRGIFGRPAARPRRSMRLSRSCFGCWLRRSTRRSCAWRCRTQEHPGVRSDGFRQDHLDQGADPRDPAVERLITIEDARELVLDRHPNHVRLFYSKDDQGLARVTPKQLLESCLRMKPDRILLGGAPRRGGLRLPAQREFGPPRFHHEYPRRQAVSSRSSSWCCSSSKVPAGASSPGATSRVFSIF